jgi:hypothetical protein
MNNPNENQHFVSQVLLKRFKIAGNPLQCYQVQTGEWIPKSPENACSSPGYNQLVISGQPDNSMEADFSKVESRLPKTFDALQEAAKNQSTELPPEIYENLHKYCTLLNLTALFSKPGAVVSFVFHINWELQKGTRTFLRKLEIPEEVIAVWQKEHTLGRRVIVESENVLQSLYQFQFKRSKNPDYDTFRLNKWTICNSPIELPVSDVGIVPISLPAHEVVCHILPIGPKLVLKGLLFYDAAKNSSKPVVSRLDLNPEEAEYLFDCICSSAVTEIVCSRINPEVAASIERAKTKGIHFHKIANPESIKSAGLKNASDELRYRIVSVEEYKQFVWSFMMPGNPQPLNL